MDKRQRKKFDKLLFTMLARHPSEFRLIGDTEGWVRIKDLHKALLEERLFPHITPKAIEQHLLVFRPKGFEVSEGRVRALPGLQDPGIFDYANARPPEMLFAPIRPKALHYVEDHGLGNCRENGWIVLFSSRKEALLYGKRFHNKPMLCKITAGKAYQDGVQFRHAGGGLYLAKKIERQWLILPQIRDEFVREKPRKKSSEESLRSTVDSETEFLRQIGGFSPSVASFEELFKKNDKIRSRKRSKYLDKKKRKR